ncbi:MAG TPA: type II toxin-antitoxin system HicB family antitoxin [Spirochaetia bacterium]|nr:type II toxin-antitoxin system HicB family antitoxin [Spirochaetia bacterium]
MGYRVSVVVQKDSHGYYAFSPEIEGCQTAGETLEDVFERTKNTIKQYLEPRAACPTK